MVEEWWPLVYSVRLVELRWNPFCHPTNVCCCLSDEMQVSVQSGGHWGFAELLRLSVLEFTRSVCWTLERWEVLVVRAGDLCAAEDLDTTCCPSSLLQT